MANTPVEPNDDNKDGPHDGTTDEEGDVLDHIVKHYAASGRDITLPGITAVAPSREKKKCQRLVLDSARDTKVVYDAGKRGGGDSMPTPREGNREELVAPTPGDAIPGVEEVEDHPNPPVPAEDPAVPGAYALAPGGPLGRRPLAALTDERDVEGGDAEPGLAQDPNNDGLAVANPVDSNDENLPRADEYVDMASNWQSSRGILVVLGFGLLSIVGIAIGVTVSQTNKNSPDVLFAEPISTSPSFSPTSYLEGYIYGILPGHSLDKLEDPDSPQSKAYAWLLEDLRLTNFDIEQEWRVLQRFALSTLYYATKGYNWTNSENWLSHEHHECTWYASEPIRVPLPGTGPKYFGVEHANPCHLSAEQLSALNPNSGFETTEATYKQLWLHQNKLDGTLPEETWLLTSLKTMSFFNNKLEGTLAPWIGNLKDLQACIFSKLSLGGSIPSEIGLLKQLAFVLMERNQITGTFPYELTNLSNLEVLLLDGNQLQGTLPDMSKLSNLEALYLQSNLLTGSIPTQIGLLSSLKAFPIQNNGLTGPIPSELGSLTALTSLILEENKFTGTIPSEIFQLKNLTVLYIGSNFLTGSVPTQLGLLSSLRLTRWNNLFLTGVIPSQVGNLQGLMGLGLYEGQFTGLLPTEIGNMDSLKRIEVQGNRLTGQLPSEIAMLPNLKVFVAQDNRFTGSIPAELKKQINSPSSNLAVFNVSKNPLTLEAGSDSVPFCWIDESFLDSPKMSEIPSSCVDAYPRVRDAPGCQCIT